MYCPNCGKTIKDYDNFCRYCGADLREEPVNQEIISKINRENEIKKEEEENVKKIDIPHDNGEELVLFDVKKH